MKNSIHITKQARVGYLHLNKAPANGYEIHLLTLLGESIQQLNEDPEVKVVVIQSALAKFFCAGADIKVFQANTVEQNKEMVVAARKVTSLISSSPKIFIAAIQGHCLGGGLELAMACDLRLAAQGNYLIGLSEVKLGLMPGNGGTIRLINLIGSSRAMEMLLTGDNINAETAYHFGLFNRLFPPEIFEQEVKQYAEKLASGPGKAMAQIKQFNRMSLGLNVQEALDLETQCVDTLYGTGDAIEGFQAFVEKRQPNFE